MGSLFLIASCTSDTGTPSVRKAPAESTESLKQPVKGWIDGSPAEADRGARSEMDSASYGAAGSEKLLSATDAESSMAPPDPGSAFGSGEAEGVIAPPTDMSLRAGNVDDNEAFEEYLQYRQDALASGIEVHDFNPNGRYHFSVKDATGRPVLGADVVVRSGEKVVAQARTHSDGTAIVFVPVDAAADQQQSSFDVSVTKGESVQRQKLDGKRDVTFQFKEAIAAPPVQADVLFVIDATGSMGDEIEQLKSNMVTVAEQLGSLDPRPDIHFGMTVFRDEGDAFVTRTFDFTADVDALVAGLRAVEAGGGGDTPEAVNQALAEGIHTPAWRGPDTIKLMFLIGDAAPHLDQGTDYVKSIADAAAAGIKIHPVASSGLDDQGEFIFRQLALGTGGMFNFLTYGAAGAPSPGDSTTHHVSDYAVLSLDALIIELVKTELQAPAAEPAPPTEEPAPPTEEPKPSVPEPASGK